MIIGVALVWLFVWSGYGSTYCERVSDYGMCGISVQCGRDRGRRVRGGLGDEFGGIERRGEIEVVAVAFLGFG